MTFAVSELTSHSEKRRSLAQAPDDRRETSRMNKEVLKQIEAISPGDLVYVRWNDASIGSSFRTTGIQTPVKTWGIYVGSVGEPKHMILTQNDFVYNYELRDDDYTAIPHPWAVKVEIRRKQEVTPEEAELMLKNILNGAGTRRRRRIFQMRTKNNERTH